MVDACIGGKGFIGSAIVRYANTYTETECIAITRENYELWKGKSFRNIYWAAGTARKDLPFEKLEQLNALAVSDALQDFKYDKFIYISSQAVYNEGKVGVESDLICPKELSDYGYSKYKGETAVIDYAPSFLVIRTNGFTGPGLKKNVIHSMAKNPPELYYTWDSKAQYIHVDHFAHILFKLASRYSGEIFNVTSPDWITPVDVASIFGIDVKKVKAPADRILPHVVAIVNTEKMERVLRNELWEPLPSSKEAVKFWNEPFKIPMPKLWKSVGKSVS
jgi:nucleoside-diphosphate-sugar epimerase